METITEDSLEKEAVKRIKKRVSINRTRFTWVVVFNIFGIIVLYFYLFVIRGRDFAIENIFLTIAPILAIDGFASLGYLVYLFFYQIPEEIFQEQRKIIVEHLPSQLTLDITHTPNLLSKDGRDFRAIALLVTNMEKNKLVEFQALINFEHFYCINDGDTVRETGYEFNAPLYWVGSEPPETEIDLRPQTGKVVLVCELTKAKTERNENIDIALVGSSPTPTAVDFSYESVYYFRILFQGKLEGEFDFRTFHYKGAFYANPAKQRILFIDEAEKAYSDISKKLLERSKSVIKYMESRIRDKATVQV